MLQNLHSFKEQQLKAAVEEGDGAAKKLKLREASLEVRGESNMATKELKFQEFNKEVLLHLMRAKEHKRLLQDSITNHLSKISVQKNTVSKERRHLNSLHYEQFILSTHLEHLRNQTPMPQVQQLVVDKVPEGERGTPQVQVLAKLTCSELNAFAQKLQLTAEGSSQQLDKQGTDGNGLGQEEDNQDWEAPESQTSQEALQTAKQALISFIEKQKKERTQLAQELKAL